MTPEQSLLYSLLGDLPARDRKISARLLEKRPLNTFTLEVLELDLNDEEIVPAYFLTPAQGEGPFPVVLYNHWHGGEYDLGKEQVLQPIRGSRCTPWGEALTAQGYAVLAIDHWNFGERAGRGEGACFKQMIWRGRVLWGMMVYDSLKAVDYLQTRDDVDPTRIATLGMSMGSTMAWWLAALDERIRVCVDLCCLTDFESLIAENRLDLHGIYYYVPSLLKHFDTIGINRLIAPRPHLAVAGNYDALTPTAGLAKIDRALQEEYARHNACEAWKLIRYNIGHRETHSMRHESLAFLKQWL